jgi:hypothetical protein
MVVSGVMRAIALLAAIFLIGAALVGYSMVSVSEQGEHSHKGSPAYAPNGWDVSTLNDEYGGRDGALHICDRTENGDKAKARAWNGDNPDNIIATVVDENGAGPPCYDTPTGGGQGGAGGHDTCASRHSTGPCGANSDHGI